MTPLRGRRSWLAAAMALVAVGAVACGGGHTAAPPKVIFDKGTPFADLLVPKLESGDNYELSRMPPLKVRGYGSVQPSTLRQSAAAERRASRGDSAGRWTPTKPLMSWHEDDTA